MAGPLKGVKVLDLSRILAGPWATQVLADYGAKVIKVERPVQGDDTRKWGPPFLQDSQGNESVAGYFLAANRGKQSITLDFTQEQGQQILIELIKSSDILVENFKVGTLKKYQLDYQSIYEINPAIIYCSITGFGQTGPNADKPGYDAMIQGMGGLMSITGEKDELPGGGPQKVGVAVADLMTGMYAVSAILAALYLRKITGEGQYIDLSLLDTQVAFLANQNMNYLLSGQSPQRQGTSHPNIVPYQAVRAKNGYFMLAVGNDRQFSRFCRLIERAELANDERFATNSQRVANRETLLQIIEVALGNQEVGYWLNKMAEENVPCGPINNLAEVFAEPQVKSREMLFHLPHSNGGFVPQVANPVKFSASTIEYKSPPPALGEHTVEVLREMGISDQLIDLLKKQGTI